MVSYLEKSIVSARGTTDLIRTKASPSGASATGGSLFAAPTQSAMYSIGGGDSLAAEQYRRNDGWTYVCINAIAKRAARQPIKMAVKPSVMSSNRSMDRFTKGFNQSAYGVMNKRRFAREFTGEEIARARNNKSLPYWVKDAISSDARAIEQHEFLDAINNPNDLLTKTSLLTITVSAIELTGRCYWWVYENSELGKIEIWPIPVSWVKPIHSPKVNFAFKVTPPLNPTKGFTIPGDQMAVFTLPDPSNPIVSLSPMQTQIKAVKVDESIQTAQAKAMENGIFPGVMIRAGRLPDQPGGVPGERPVLTPDQRADLISAIKGVYQGVNNFDEPFIVDGLIEDVQPFTRTPAEMAFLESGTVVKSRIFGAFGVNPIIVGEIAGANRAQAAVAEDNFVSNVVNPILEMIGEVITQWVGQSANLSSFGSGNNVVIWVEPAESHDADLELARWTFAEAAGAVSKNEIRVTILKLPPMEGEENDKLPMAVPLQDRAANQPDGKRKVKPVIEPPEDATDNADEGKSSRRLGQKSLILGANGMSFLDSQIITSDMAVKSFGKSRATAESHVAATVHEVIAAYGRDIAKSFLRHSKTWQPQSNDFAGSAMALATAIVSETEFADSIKSSISPYLYEFSAKAAISSATVIQSNKRINDLRTKSSVMVDFTDDMSEAMVRSISDSIKKTMTQDYWLKIPQTVRNMIAKTITEGLENGDTAKEIADRIVRDTKGRVGLDRAKVISATETASAMNMGNYEAIKAMYEDSLLDGDVSYIKGIRWRTMEDIKVRCTHTTMDNVVVKIGQMFKLPISCRKIVRSSKGAAVKRAGYESAPYPGYYGLSAGNRVRCRCTATAELKFEG